MTVDDIIKQVQHLSLPELKRIRNKVNERIKQLEKREREGHIYEKKYKIEEAKYFLSQMIRVQNNGIVLRYNLSAFLSAARSALQYTYEEVQGTPNQMWYQKRVKAAPSLSSSKINGTLTYITDQWRSMSMEL